ncbi:MAG: hypothetical protein EOO47_08175 [Flavobacterium sp.]|nr:MAG: hypothetical protein EOO47_08175 [Flavobacterium sp.]
MSKTTEPYYGDLEKTEIIANLFAVPKEDRNENWTRKFIANMPAASFRCGDPQVIAGPDGFPYFQLFLPEPNTPFTCYVVDKIKDDFLLEKGFGVVFNLVDGEPDYVLSYGDILNWHLNKEFYTEHSAFSKLKTDEVLVEDEEVLVGQPNENILPVYTQKLLGDYLRLNGIKDPKMALIMRNDKKNKDFSQDLAFNIGPNDFENEQMYRAVMGNLAWYLPRHYSYIGITYGSMKNDFTSI